MSSPTDKQMIRPEKLAQKLKCAFCAGYLHAIFTGARLRPCAEPAPITRPRSQRRRFSQYRSTHKQ